MNEEMIERYFGLRRKPGSKLNIAEDVFKNTAPSSGYLPPRHRMTIGDETGKMGALQCDYDPAEFTEKHSLDWEVTPVTGKGTTPIQFKTVNPREWSMKLLFNTLGDNDSLRSPAQETTVKEALELLRKLANPNYYNGTIATTSAGSERPPTLTVFLIDKALRCVITSLSITVKAIHPLKRIPTRAEVDITFTEFVESSA